MRSIGEALREMVPCFARTEVVISSLADAQGLVLASDLDASADLPGFDNSAMDGYAVRHEDLALGRPLTLFHESRAGGPLPPPLEAGHAQRIFTGAPLPAGADSVLMQENARAEDGALTALELPARGANVRLRGSDLRRGEPVLKAGTALGPGELSLLAALEQAEVPVHRRPRVAIVSTGDELRELGAPAREGSIVNSNAVLLAAQVRAAGGEPVSLPPCPDRIEEIARVLEAALACDVVITSGGVSVGDHDHVAAACERAGVTVRFWKVAVKPGKPLLFGQRGRVPVIGLPGNPVSAFVTFELFVRPGLLHMLGHAKPFPAIVPVILDEPRECPAARTELARARLHQDQSGALHATLHHLQGSGSLPSIACVDALVVLPAGGGTVTRGQSLGALLLGAAPMHAEPRIA